MSPLSDTNTDDTMTNGNNEPRVQKKLPSLNRLTVQEKSRFPSLGGLEDHQIYEFASKAAPPVVTQTTPIAGTSTEFDVRVKLCCKEGDNAVKGGHEIFQLSPNLTYGDLCTELKTKFRDILNNQIDGRSNFTNLRCYWSKNHEVSVIKALWVPNADEPWGTGEEDDLQKTIITKKNCKSVLRLLKRAPLPTMSVTIFIPGLGN